jgi:RNA polymerase sigma-70 factor (ECF subfamily)
MQKTDFAQFYSENVDRVYRFVYFRVGRDHELAEDLVSEIFMKALKHFAKYDPEQSKSAWLYTIARNHLSNYYRDRKEEIDLEEISFAYIGEKGGIPIEKREAELEVEKALQHLEADDRRLVTMKHLEGYSYKDMAEILGRSADALKVATHRAVQKMKAAMASVQRQT